MFVKSNVYVAHNDTYTHARGRANGVEADMPEKGGGRGSYLAAGLFSYIVFFSTPRNKAPAINLGTSQSCGQGCDVDMIRSYIPPRRGGGNPTERHPE